MKIAADGKRKSIYGFKLHANTDEYGFIKKMIYTHDKILMAKLKTNNNAILSYKTGYNDTETLDINKIKESVIDCHGIVDLILKDIPFDIFAVLGMRNLSAFIGELFAKSLGGVLI